MVYTYDKDSRETKTALGDITRNTVYDAWGRVKTQDWKNKDAQIFRVSYEYPDSGKNIIGLPGAVVNGGSRTEYTYDGNGNITSIKEGGKTVTYTYDGLNRLTRENNELLGKTVTYYYDEGGNLREEREYDYTTGTVSGTPKKYTAAVMDEKWKDKLLKWGSTEMTYDACGNMLKKGNTSFTWTQGRKLSAISNGKSIRYYYDHTGARVKKVVDGVTTEYRMAGSLIVSERAGDETIWYQYDSAARLVAMMIGGARYNYVRNVQNDIIGLIDSAGKRVVSYKYDSWGKTISITGTLAATIGKKNPFRYRGYYFDAESGMYYLQSRYYDPEIRRFVSADNVGFLSANSAGLKQKNLYAYCENNPVVRLDNGGQFWETIFDVISLGASIVEVCENPIDPWAWAGLVGDTIDLIPCVTGVGEATRAVKTTIKAVDKSTDVVEAAKTLYKTADIASDIRKSTGSYEILYKSGKNYIEKGGFARAINSATRNAEKYGDIVTAIRWKSAPNARAAFIDEYLMQKRFGGVLSSNKELRTYNKIWSPGRRYFGDR